MVRQSYIIRRVLKSILHRRVHQFLLVAGLALAPGGGAGAFVPAPSIGAGGNAIGNTTGTLLHRTGLCADGSYDCSDYAPAPEYAPRDHAYRWAPPPGPYESGGPIEEAPIEEPPCEQPRYAARSFVEHVVPPPGPHEGRWDALCGVGCWYKRLRTGYCGRGCDYYRYRLNDYPEGKLLASHERRLACRAEH